MLALQLGWFAELCGEKMKKCKFAIFHFVFVVVALVDFIPTYFSKRFCGFFYVLAMQNMGQAKNERRWQAISNNPLHSRLFVSPHFLRDRNIQNIVCSPMEMLAWSSYNCRSKQVFWIIGNFKTEAVKFVVSYRSALQQVIQNQINVILQVNTRIELQIL